MKVSINSDQEIVAEIRKKITQNSGYCPCRITKSPDNKCVCKEFRDMIARREAGMCHCGLYVLEAVPDDKNDI